MDGIVNAGQDVIYMVGDVLETLLIPLFFASMIGLLIATLVVMWIRRELFIWFGLLMWHGFPQFARWQRWSVIAYWTFAIIDFRYRVVDWDVVGLGWIPFSMLVLIAPSFIKLMRGVNSQQC